MLLLVFALVVSEGNARLSDIYCGYSADGVCKEGEILAYEIPHIKGMSRSADARNCCCKKSEIPHEQTGPKANQKGKCAYHVCYAALGKPKDCGTSCCTKSDYCGRDLKSGLPCCSSQEDHCCRRGVGVHCKNWETAPCCLEADGCSLHTTCSGNSSVGLAASLVAFILLLSAVGVGSWGAHQLCKYSRRRRLKQEMGVLLSTEEEESSRTLENKLLEKKAIRDKDLDELVGQESIGGRGKHGEIQITSQDALGDDWEDRTL
eukprot:Platyproteum_vivax@DN5554_c0_g1_i3.p1